MATRLVAAAAARERAALRRRLGAVGGEIDRGEHGGVPGPEVLGAVVAACHLLQVLVDLGRLDVGPGAAPAAVGEQLVAAAVAVLQRLDRRDDHRIGDLLVVVERALGLVLEAGDAARAPRRACAAGSRARTSRSPPRSARCRSERSRGRATAPRRRARAPAPGRASRGRPSSARASSAGTSRTAPSRRTSRGLAPRASAGGRGTACGRRRRSRSPGCGRSGAGRSIPPSTPAGSRAR